MCDLEESLMSWCFWRRILHHGNLREETSVCFWEKRCHGVLEEKSYVIVLLGEESYVTTLREKRCHGAWKEVGADASVLSETKTPRSETL